MPDIHSADGDLPVFFGQFDHFIQKQHQGRLPRSRSCDNAECRSGFHSEGDVMQNLRTAFIRKGNMLEADISVQQRLTCVGKIFFFFRIHDRRNALDRNTRLGHFSYHPAQHTDRPGEHSIVGNKSNVFARGHLAADAEHCAENDHQHYLDAGKNILRAPVKAEDFRQPDPKTRIVFVMSFKTVSFPALAPESTDNPHTCQILLHHVGKFAFILVAFQESFPDFPVENNGVDNDKRHGNSRYHCKFPVHGKHKCQ